MEEKKPLTLRLPLSTWRFLKKKAVDQETTLTELIVNRLTKYKNKCENKLTNRDTMVS